jgi:hypothetical protein
MSPTYSTFLLDLIFEQYDDYVDAVTPSTLQSYFFMRLLFETGILLKDGSVDPPARSMAYLIYSTSSTQTCKYKPLPLFIRATLRSYYRVSGLMTVKEQKKG